MVNKVMLVGHLTSDPEVRAAQTGTYVTNVRLATNVYGGKADDGTARQFTDFHNVVFFGKQAEFAGANLQKGRMICVIGRLHNSSWDDVATGQKRYRSEVIADEFHFVGPKPKEAAA